MYHGLSDEQGQAADRHRDGRVDRLAELDDREYLECRIKEHRLAIKSNTLPPGEGGDNLSRCVSALWTLTGDAAAAYLDREMMSAPIECNAIIRDSIQKQAREILDDHYYFTVTGFLLVLHSRTTDKWIHSSGIEDLFSPENAFKAHEALGLRRMRLRVVGVRTSFTDHALNFTDGYHVGRIDCNRIAGLRIGQEIKVGAMTVERIDQEAE